MADQLLIIVSRVRRYLTRRRLVFIVLCAAGVILLGALGIHALEARVNPKLATLGHAILWAAATVAAAGGSEIQPITEPGFVLRVVLKLAGTGFIGLFTAAVATIFLDALLREGKGLRPVRLPAHLLILGFNDKAPLIIEEIRRESSIPITLLADLPEKPFDAPDFTFVRGKPYEEDSLRRADIAHAESAIILADTAEGPPSDARTVLAALAVESLRPEVYTCVEAVNSRSIEHLERAGVDEVLPSNSLLGHLLARSSLNRGVISAVTDLASAGSGAEISVRGQPRGLAGKTFGEALGTMYAASGVVLVGLRRGGEVLISPKSTTLVESDDELVVVAEERLRNPRGPGGG